MAAISENAAGRSRQSLAARGFTRIIEENRGNIDDARTV
jgi:hypothetical protein